MACDREIDFSPPHSCLTLAPVQGPSILEIPSAGRIASRGLIKALLKECSKPGKNQLSVLSSIPFQPLPFCDSVIANCKERR